MISEAYLSDNMRFMASITDKFFGLTIADPQYGIGAGTMGAK